MITTKNSGDKPLLQANSVAVIKLNFSKTLPSWVKENPTRLLNYLTPSDQRVYNYFIDLKQYYGKVFPPIERIASRLGVATSTVKLASGKLRALGLVDWVTPELWSNKANEYFLHPIMHDHGFRAALAPFFKAIRIIPLALLLSVIPDINCITNRISATNISLKEKVSLSKVRLFKNVIDTDTDESLSRELTGRARMRTKGRISHRSKNHKERRMKSESAVKAIKSIAFTSWGQYRLTAFPAEAIEWADKQIGSIIGSVKEPARYFTTLCIKWCRMNNQIADYTHINDFIKKTPEAINFSEVEESWTPQVTESESVASPKKTVSRERDAKRSTVGIDLDAMKRQAYFNSKGAGKFKDEVERAQWADKLGVYEEARPSYGTKQISGPLEYRTHEEADWSSERAKAVDVLKERKAVGQHINKYAEILIGDREAAEGMDWVFARKDRTSEQLEDALKQIRIIDEHSRSNSQRRIIDRNNKNPEIPVAHDIVEELDRITAEDDHFYNIIELDRMLDYSMLEEVLP